MEIYIKYSCDKGADPTARPTYLPLSYSHVLYSPSVQERVGAPSSGWGQSKVGGGDRRSSDPTEIIHSRGSLYLSLNKIFPLRATPTEDSK